MMVGSSPVIILIFLSICVPILTQIRLSDCEKQAPASLSSIQKSKLCSDPTTGAKRDVGPAKCAVTAKDLLKGTITADELILLCQSAPSSAPAKCMRALDPHARKEYGLELCEC